MYLVFSAPLSSSFLRGANQCGTRWKMNSRQITTEWLGTGERIAINIDLKALMGCNIYWINYINQIKDFDHKLNFWALVYSLPVVPMQIGNRRKSWNRRVNWCKYCFKVIYRQVNVIQYEWKLKKLKTLYRYQIIYLN